MTIIPRVRSLMGVGLAAAIIGLVPPTAATAAGVRIALSESQLVVSSSALDTAVAVAVRNDGDTATAGELSWGGAAGGNSGAVVTPSQRAYQVPAHSMIYYTFKVSGTLPGDGSDLTVASGELKSSLAIRRGLSLSEGLWRWRVSDKIPPCLDAGWQKPGFDDSAWDKIALPSAAQDGRYQWYRTSIAIPAEMKGSTLWLEIGNVDEADVTYFNGAVIGKGSGWDKRRLYKIPADSVNWSGQNSVVIMADNASFGGGIYMAPLRVIAGTPIQTQVKPSSKASFATRPAPGPVGAPLPFRPMAATDGVLRYSDGGEVALMGVNYLAQSWYHYTALTNGGFDHKATIDQDFEHMAKMGVEVIRIHVFDTEISDTDGNLVENEHLDLLDYIVKKAQEKGMYLFLTPIAWWGSPSQLPDAFSVMYSKESMLFDPEAIRAEVNYTKQLLKHRNPYTGRAYKDEPNLCALEIMNEPEPKYLAYEAMAGAIDAPPQVKLLQGLWHAWLAKTGLPDSPGSYYLFSHDLVRDWANTLYDAIRSTGARQPIAAPTFSYQWIPATSIFGDSPKGEAVLLGLVDSKCEAITVSAYPGGLTEMNDGRNLLSEAVNNPLPAVLNGKVRLVYEFDAAGTMKDNYLYPALARMWRYEGVQIAAQFQYDSAVLSDYNSAWTTHYLNWLYTPGKSLAMLAAEEAFDRIPRETAFAPRTDIRKDDQVFGDFAVSSKRNLAVLSSPDMLIHTGPFAADWPPLKLPEAPDTIAGLGSSPYVTYDGTGLYRLTGLHRADVALEVTPDVTYFRHPMDGGEGPVAELSERQRTMSLKLPGNAQYQLFRRGAAGLTDTGQKGTSFKVLPGEYVLEALGGKQ